MEHAPGIDVVTRLYDLADLPHLDRLVFSIMGQAAATPLHLHVMLQRFSFAEMQKVRETMHDLRRLGNGTGVTLHNWDNPAPFDLRVPLLNWGIEVAQGRYFTCLDVQEQLCPHGCSALLARPSVYRGRTCPGGHRRPTGRVVGRRRAACRRSGRRTIIRALLPGRPGSVEPAMTSSSGPVSLTGRSRSSSSGSASGTPWMRHAGTTSLSDGCARSDR